MRGCEGKGILGLTLLLLLAGAAQGLEHLWSRSLSAEGNVVPEALARHGERLYVAGSFTGRLEIGGDVFISQSLHEYDVFLFCFEEDFQQNHDYLWGHSFGDADNDKLRDMIVDENGVIVITGDFFGSIDFGGAPLQSAGDKDVFVAAFDGFDGGHSWSLRFGDEAYDSGQALAGDGSDGLLLAGQFFSQIDFGQGPHSSFSGQAPFVVNLDASGNVLWSESYSCAGSSRVHDLALTDTGFAMAGSFDGALNLGTGDLVAVDEEDGFVGFWGFDAWPLWNFALSGAGVQEAKALVGTGGGELLVAGDFESGLDGPGISLYSAGGKDIFLLQFDGSGYSTWNQSFGDHEDQEAEALALSPDGIIGLTGGVSGSVDFGGGPLSAAGYGQPDIFLAGFDADGQHVWSHLFGDEWEQWGTALQADGNRWFLAGVFSETVDFGGGVLVAEGLYNGALACFGAPTAAPAEAAQGMELSCWPNPFNPRIEIRLRLDETRAVSLDLHDNAGRRVARLLDRETLEAGEHLLSWTGRDEQNRALASGLYLLRARAGESRLTRKLLLLR